MEFKNKIINALSEMTENECENLCIYLPRRFFRSEKQKNCNHSMKYDMATGGSTCTLCHWMS